MSTSRDSAYAGRMRPRLWLLFAWLALPACGDDKPAAGSSFTTTTGGGGGGSSTTGVGGGPIIVSDGGGGAMQDGPDTGSRDAADARVNPSLCTYGTARLDGTWNGASFMRTFKLQS